MKKIICSLFVLSLLASIAIAAVPHTSYGRVLSADTSCDWKFYRVDKPSEQLSGKLQQAGTNIAWQALVGNLSTWVENDDSVVMSYKEDNAGKINHKGYYAVMNEKITANPNPQPYNDCTLRAIPKPNATANPGSTSVKWTAIPLIPDVSATPNTGNVIGYNVYRIGTDGFTATKINTSMVANPGSGDVTYTDTAGAGGAQYYYAIEPVLIGGVALGVKSENSNQITFQAAPTFANLSFTPDPYNFSISAGSPAVLTSTAPGVIANNAGTGDFVYTNITADKAWVTSIKNSQGNTGGEISKNASDNFFVTVDLTGKPAGFNETATITLLSTSPNNGKNTFKVNAQVTSATLISINITPSNSAIDVNATQQYTAIGTYSDGSTPNITSNVTWNSSKPAVASISNVAPNNGKATAISGGDSTNITATLSGKTSNIATLTVNASLPTDPVITSITWDANPNTIYGTISINGDKFGNDPGKGNYSTAVNNIKIDGKTLSETIDVSGQPGTQIYYWSMKKITVGVPIKASGASDYITAGSKQVTVTAGSKPSNWWNITIKPNLYGLTPTFGPKDTEVTINGTGFGNNKNIVHATVDGQAAEVISTDYLPNGLQIANKVKIKIPAIAAGKDKPVVVYLDNSEYSNSLLFEVTQTPVAPAPTISSVYNKKVYNDSGEKEVKENWVYVTPYDPTWTAEKGTDEALNLIIDGAKFGGGDGSSEAPAGASLQIMVPGSQTYESISFYWWSDQKIELGIPATLNNKIVSAGNNAVIKVITSGGADTQSFTIKPRIYGIKPGTAMVSDEVTINGSGFGPDSANLAVNFNDTNVNEFISSTSTEIKVKVPVLPVGKTSVTVTKNTVLSNLATLEVVDLTPKISLVAPASAEVGQTININGKNFGASKGSSLVRFGTAVANPTIWTDKSITLAIPSDAPTGETTVTLVTDKGTAESKITISDKNIMIDDFDGGCVGTFDPNIAKDSGYYAFGAGITPDKNTICKDGPQPEAIFPVVGAYKGMKIKYSYATGEAAGWGGKLANVLNISRAKGISVYIKWDKSSNDLKLVLKDKNGLAAETKVSNASLMNADYAKISIPVANFAPALGFDWTKIAEYSVIYTSKATSEGVQYFDTLMAYTQGEVSQTEVQITSIDPIEAPAGTKINVNGKGFGFTQGQSTMIFENIETKTAVVAEVSKWGDTQIQAKVPLTALAGVYNVRVIKVAIASGILNAQESNNQSFKVTAAAAAAGVVTAYPNPFNPLSNDASMNKVTLVYNPGTATNIGVYIYDMTAKLVYKSVVSTGQTTWDGKDTWSNYVGNGAYVIRVVNEDNKSIIAKGKVLVVKE